MLPTIFASTRRVPRVIPLLNPHHQNTFPLSVRPYSPPSHRKRKRRYAGSQIVASVAGTTRKIRLVSRRKWCLVTSVVVVVGFYNDYTPRVLLTYARPSNLHGSWYRCRSCPFLPLEVRRMQDVRDLSGKRRRCMRAVLCKAANH
jgi:predicted alpha/beta hydrolase